MAVVTKPIKGPRSADAGMNFGRLLSRFWFLAIPVAAITAFFWFRSRPVQVETTRPVYRDVTESIAASARVRGDVESDIGAQNAGRVAEVSVKEGDQVSAGQIIARQEDAVLRQQADQAEAALHTAQAQLVLARRGPLPSEIDRLKADINEAVRVAQAKRDTLQQKLTELQRGPTAEEKQQASGQLRQARAAQTQSLSQVEQLQAVVQQIEAQRGQTEAQLTQADRDLERQKELHAQGATSQADLDRAETARVVAAKALEGARQSVSAAQRNVESARAAIENANGAVETAAARLRQLQIGTRREQLAQARSDLAAQEATLAGARKSGQEQLKTLLAQPRREDVTVAETRVREARQNLDVARRRVHDTLITAPFAGTVAKILVYPGGVTGANQPILRLLRTKRLELRTDIDENNLGRLKLGQEAMVTSDAFPDTKFKARIREIGAQVDAEKGTVEVRLDPVDAPVWLRPGQTVSVNVVVDKATRRLVVPLTAIRTIGDRSLALVLKDGKVEERPVKIGPPGSDGFPVLSGLSENDHVILGPAGIQAGQKARE